VSRMSDIIDGVKKQGNLFFGSKEDKQEIVKDILKQAQDNGVDVKNVTVSKDIFAKLDNAGYLISDFSLGWSKCSVIPKSVGSFVGDKIIATTSKKANIINIVEGVATCYFETFDQSASSQGGVQFMLDIGLAGVQEFIEHIE